MIKSGKKKQGRPRCEFAKEAVLKAAWSIICERSLRSLSLEGVARNAGVGKTTIYRWWKGRLEIALEAFFIESGDAFIDELRIFQKRLEKNDVNEDWLALISAFTYIFVDYLVMQSSVLADLTREKEIDPEAFGIFESRLLKYPESLLSSLLDKYLQKSSSRSRRTAKRIAKLVFQSLVYNLLMFPEPNTELFLKSFTTTFKESNIEIRDRKTIKDLSRSNL